MKNVHEIEIKIEGKEWEECLDKSFKKKIKDVKVDGFRKGACPKDVYLKKFGKESLYMDAVDQAIEIAYEKCMEENNLIPVIQPTLDVKNIDENAVTLSFKIITKPEIKLGAYKDLKIKKETVEVSNKEIEEDNLELEEEKSEEQDKIETDVPLIKDVQDNSTDEQIKVYENFNNDLPVQNNNIEENNVTNDNIIPDLKPEEVEEPIVNKEMPDWLKPVVKENENKVLEPTEEVNEEKPDKKDNDKVKPNKKPGGSLGGDTTRPEHTHEYIWKNFDSMIEKGICSCGKEETRLHTLSDWKYGTISDERECTTCDYIDIRNHIHNYTEWTIVNDTETRKCLTCGKEETREHTHEFSEWKFDGVNSDTRVCQTCKLEQTRDHIHTEVPEDLEYIYKSSNNDGTHTLEAKYTCEICGQEFSNIKTEECKFGKEEVENKGKNVLNEPYNEHYVTSSCEICDYENKVLKPCTPDSELKAIKLNGTIFEYYDCIECNGYVNRKEHTEHHIIYDDEYTTDTNRLTYL